MLGSGGYALGFVTQIALGTRVYRAFAVLSFATLSPATVTSQA